MIDVSTIFVVDTPDFVIMTRSVDKDCIYPVYRFDNEYHAARAACEDIARMKDKLIMNRVYNVQQPLLYNSNGIVVAQETTTPVEDNYRSRLKGIIA